MRPVVMNPAPVARVVIAGLAGGLVDAVYASIRSLIGAGSVTLPWRAVASGWLGGSAYQGGVPATALGLGTHFAIATAMAAAWVWGLSGLTVVRARPIGAAVAYGLGLYGIMYLVVLPLRWPSVFPRWDGAGSVLDILAHVAVALVIAWCARPGQSTPGQAGAAVAP